MKKNNDYVTSSVERLSYGAYFIGQLFFYILVTNFLQLYMTDIGIPAAVVGGVFIIAKIWDAINDPLFGIIVDKVNMKKGKFIPWVRLSTILIPISTDFMFATPSTFSVQVKIIWALFAYLFWDTSYTLCDVPIYALATSMTNVMKERNTLLIYAKLFGFIGGLIATVFVPIFYPAIGWTWTALILSVIGIAIMTPVGYIARERHEASGEESPTIKSLLRYLVRNKFLLLFSGVVIIASVTNTTSAVMNYAAIHCFGGPRWIMIIAATMSAPILISIPLLQFLITKCEKYLIYTVSLGVSLASGVLMYFAGYASLPLFFALLVLRSFFSTMNVSLSTIFTADCAEYGSWKSGERAQGVAFSIQTFTAKLIAAVSSAVCMFILALAGFVEGEGAVQSEKTVKAIWFLFSAAPAITGVISLALMILFYKLRDKDVQIMAKFNAGEISREEAESSMSRVY
jgi:sugar (glycoside-pentoside-hexuronide) transporter